MVVVVEVTPNCTVLCAAGAGTAGEPVPATDGVDHFPKRDLTAGCGAT